MLNFIVNPNAGGERSYRRWKSIERYLLKKGVEYKVYITGTSGEASKIAADISSHKEQEVIISVGGDGTINEVIDGANIHDNVIFGYIPTGSGNDLARGLKLPRNPIRCLKRILHPKEIKNIDYGVVHCGESQHRRFIVACGIGFDAEVCYGIEDQRLKRGGNAGIKKKLMYITVGLRTILRHRPVKASVLIGGVKRLEFNHLIFVSSHNHAFEGGGFRLAPKADNTDGELSICIVHHRSKFHFIRIMLSALFGNHMKYSGVRSYDSKEVRIKLDEPLAVHTDGELFGRHSDIEVRCIKQKLRFIM